MLTAGQGGDGWSYWVGMVFGVWLLMLGCPSVRWGWAGGAVKWWLL